MTGGSEVADLVSLWHAAKRNFWGFKTTDPRLYQDQWLLVAPLCQASLHTVYTLCNNNSWELEPGDEARMGSYLILHS